MNNPHAGFCHEYGLIGNKEMGTIAGKRVVRLFFADGAELFYALPIEWASTMSKDMLAFIMHFKHLPFDELGGNHE